MGTGRRLSSSVTSAAVKVTPNLSPSTKSGSNNNNNNNPKLSSLNQSPFAAASASPISRGRNVLSVRKIASENEMDENRFKIDEVMYVLKRFKEHMGEYSYDEVNLVKREVEGLFEMESNLIKKYSESLIQQMSSSLQQHNNTV
jgi:DNA helicase HerA-like ATPase